MFSELLIEQHFALLLVLNTSTRRKNPKLTTKKLKTTHSLQKGILVTKYVEIFV